MTHNTHIHTHTHTHTHTQCRLLPTCVASCVEEERAQRFSGHWTSYIGRCVLCVLYDKVGVPHVHTRHTCDFSLCVRACVRLSAAITYGLSPSVRTRSRCLCVVCDIMYVCACSAIRGCRSRQRRLKREAREWGAPESLPSQEVNPVKVSSAT